MTILSLWLRGEGVRRGIQDRVWDARRGCCVCLCLVDGCCGSGCPRDRTQFRGVLVKPYIGVVSVVVVVLLRFSFCLRFFSIQERIVRCSSAMSTILRRPYRRNSAGIFYPRRLLKTDRCRTMAYCRSVFFHLAYGERGECGSARISDVCTGLYW